MNPISLTIKRWIKKTVLSFLVWSHGKVSVQLVKRATKMLSIDFIHPAEDISVDDFLVCRYKYGAKAAFCISIDFDAIREEMIRQNPEGTRLALLMSEEHNIPMTWLICGSTALEEQAAYNLILSSKTKQDVGIHTYTHLDWTRSSREEAEIDLKKCVDLISKTCRPVSFAFPYNRKNHLDLLNQVGIVTYRSKNRIFGYPSKIDGLWRIAPVYYLDKNSLEAFGLLKKFVEFCLSYHCVFHLWTHPWSIVPKGSPELALTVFDPLLMYASEKRDEGVLWVCTMRELANYCEARNNCSLVKRYDDAQGIHYVVSCSLDDIRFDFPPVITLQLKVKDFSNQDVFVDGIRYRLDEHSVTQELDGFTWLFLTITFENPVIDICVSRAEGVMT